MSQIWTGYYLDGKTAARQPVTLQPMRRALHVTLEDGRTLVWPYTEIRQTQGRYQGEQTRLEYGGELPEAVLVSDPALLDAIRAIAPESTGHVLDPSRRSARLRLTAMAAVGAVVVSIALYLWAVPALAAALTLLVPVTWEKRLGKAVTDRLAPEHLHCTESSRRAALDQLLLRLTRAAPDNPYMIDLIVVKNPTVNAFAAPGGYVVIFSGLLEATKRPEQLAGVLAHEMQHVYQRHTTRALFEHATTSVLLASLSGEFSGSAPLGIEAASMMGLLRYSREHERQADAQGLELLMKARVDPFGIIELFEILRQRGSDISGSLAYLSTHPGFRERIADLKRLAEGSPMPPEPLLPDADWNRIKRICRTT